MALFKADLEDAFVDAIAALDLGDRYSVLGPRGEREFETVQVRLQEGSAPVTPGFAVPSGFGRSQAHVLVQGGEDSDAIMEAIGSNLPDSLTVSTSEVTLEYGDYALSRSIDLDGVRVDLMVVDVAYSTEATSVQLPPPS